MAGSGDFDNGGRDARIGVAAVDGGQPGVARGAPLLGEHNRQVIQDLLQVPDDEFQRLTESGVIG